jgi:hypothetical protein
MRADGEELEGEGRVKKRVPECKDCKWMVMLKKTEMCDYTTGQSYALLLAKMRRRSGYSCGTDGKYFEPKQVDA